MKRLKMLSITAVIAVIVFVLSVCASLTLVDVDTESVTGPAQVRQFGSIDPNDITIFGIYSGDRRMPLSVSADDITFDNSRVGTQTVNVNTPVGIVSFQTEVMELNAISVASPPSNAVFLIGEDANVSWPGLEITGEWNQMGGGAIPVSSCQISGYNKEQTGRQTVTVTLGGKTASFNVEVLGLASIELESPPAKTDYETGDSLELAGIAVYGNYGTSAADRRRELIPQEQLTVSGYDAYRVGRQQVTVTARGQRAAFNVNVTPSINGTWIIKGYSESIYSFSNGYYEFSSRSEYGLRPMYRGTYTFDNDKIAFTVTHVWGAYREWYLYDDAARLFTWYTIDEVKAIFPEGWDQFGYNARSGANFRSFTVSYSLSANTLTLIQPPTSTGMIVAPEQYTKIDENLAVGNGALSTKGREQWDGQSGQRAVGTF